MTQWPKVPDVTSPTHESGTTSSQASMTVTVGVTRRTDAPGCRSLSRPGRLTSPAKRRDSESQARPGPVAQI